MGLVVLCLGLFAQDGWTGKDRWMKRLKNLLRRMMNVDVKLVYLDVHIMLYILPKQGR